MATHTYTILLFAMLREKVGDSVQLNLPHDEVTAHELKEMCATQYPQLAPWLAHTKVAVNQEYADSDTKVRPEDEIAFIPPVAGG